MTKEKIRELISQMTLEEKARYVSGADFWHTEELERLGIPAVMVSDGPHGLRKQKQEGDHLGVNDSIEAVCFPAACLTAASFNREMMYEMGETLGDECQAEDVSVLLGPAVNIKRSPLCGRNFEYISEDPYLAGELSAAYIKGVQSRGVGTSIKHFAANNQEHERMNGSSNVSERALREIYFPAFEKAVKEAQPWTVMCSYNKLNGVYASENRWLLTEVLRDDWGFAGAVMSDWGAVSDRVKGLLAGLDLEMPSSGDSNDGFIIEAVKSGVLPMEQLDLCVERIMEFVFRYAENKKGGVFDRNADHEKAVHIAENSMVLLKNEGVLPLDRSEKIAFIGCFAKKPRFQGGGSSHINTKNVECALEAAKGYADIRYAEGFSAEEDLMTEENHRDALEAAGWADRIVVFAGLPDSFESEGFDREHMRLPEAQNRLIEELTELQKPVIVVLHNGSPVEMPWADRVQGILEAYLGGEGVGRAQVRILFGEVNPSGKLAETFPKKLSDNPSYLNFPGHGKQVDYAEGVFVGYRYYDTKEMDVRFPFGYGLSYTSFSYDNLRISRETFTPDDKVSVSVDITNTGGMAGREIVQLYVSDCTDSAVRPVKELKNFASAALESGETKTVTMELDFRSFAWYDNMIPGWYAQNGVYRILIGSSSRDIRLSGEVRLTGSPERIPEINPDVMIGDLLSCSVTEDFITENLLREASGFDEEQPEGMEDLAKVILKYMPLRAMRSLGDLTNEKMEKVLEGLRKIVEQHR